MSVAAPEREPGSAGEYNPGLRLGIALWETGVRCLGTIGNAWLEGHRIGQAAVQNLIPMPKLLKDMDEAYTEAGLVMTERMARPYEDPGFGIHETTINGKTVAVKETIVEAQEKPFSSLLHFETEGLQDRPKMLLIPPMSGHYPSLLRDTVKGLLPQHDVYVASWKNARDVPAEAGDFGLDDYIDNVMDYLRHLGPDTDVFAVCQATVPVLAAVARIAEETPNQQPRSLILMAGPVDGRISPTIVNQVAQERPLEWFEKNVIGKVGSEFPGAERLVYPGFMQLMSFMGMNIQTHTKSHFELYRSLVGGNMISAQKTMDFYNNYFAVSDLSKKFYLETVRKVFQEHQLARGVLKHRGRLVDPSRITKTALLVIEGEKDDICGLGQTMAAMDLCSGIPDHMKDYYQQPGVGHYGTFSGRRWEYEIRPKIDAFVALYALAA